MILPVDIKASCAAITELNELKHFYRIIKDIACIVLNVIDYIIS